MHPSVVADKEASNGSYHKPVFGIIYSTVMFISKEWTFYIEIQRPPEGVTVRRVYVCGGTDSEIRRSV